MKTVTIANLKAQLSRWMTRVEAGQSILVLERGIPVARLEPLTWPDDADVIVEQQTKRGFIHAPQNSLSDGTLAGWFNHTSNANGASKRVKKTRHK